MKFGLMVVQIVLLSMQTVHLLVNSKIQRIIYVVLVFPLTALNHTNK